MNQAASVHAPRAFHALDDFPHPVGSDPNWNESYYFFWADERSELAAFSRIGVRSNDGYVEALHGIFLGGSRVGFAHERRPTAEGGSGLHGGGLSFDLVEPMKRWRVSYLGAFQDIADGKILEIPRKQRPHDWVRMSELEIDLTFDAISEPQGWVIEDGQEHFEHFGRMQGRVRIDGVDRQVEGYAVRDHTWGPRTWQSPIKDYPRAQGEPMAFTIWPVVVFGADLAMAIIINAQADGAHRGHGLGLLDGQNGLVTDAVAKSTYLRGSVLQDRIELSATVCGRSVELTGQVINHIPTKVPTADGAIIITEGLVRWTLPDGRSTLGILEFHVKADKTKRAD